MSHGRVALVTGGAAGIGAELCRALMADGYSVVSIDRSRPSPHPDRVDLTCDLSDAAATADCASELARRFAVTHFVHNAGAIRANLVEAASAEDVAVLAQLHLGAPLTLLKAILPAMKQAGHGRVLLMSSRAALGAPTRSAYSATKAGVIGLVRTWALELAQHGITVNAIAPGPIAGTDMFHGVLPAGDPRIEALARSIPMQRLGTPADVASAARFLLSDEAGFITGQTLFVCGGASIGQAVV